SSTSANSALVVKDSARAGAPAAARATASNARLSRTKPTGAPSRRRRGALRALISMDQEVLAMSRGSAAIRRRRTVSVPGRRFRRLHPVEGLASQALEPVGGGVREVERLLRGRLDERPARRQNG